MSEKILPAQTDGGATTMLDAFRRMAESMPGGFFIYRADED